MRDIVQAIRDRGAELVLVGSGSPRQAARFRDDQGLDFPLFVDRRRAAYRAAGLHRGIARTLGPRAVGNALRALRGGFRQRRLQGDPWQQGGTLVVTPAGEVPFRHISRASGDNAEPAAVLDALDALGGV